MDALFLGLSNLIHIHVIIAILVGAIGGVIIGAIPGIGPAIAIAILLPATIFLDDLVSLVLLLGIYGSAMYGGAIPAILINTPGTPVNALTTYDGYSMTKSGDAPRALSLAYSSSFFWGLFLYFCSFGLSYCVWSLFKGFRCPLWTKRYFYGSCVRFSFTDTRS